MIRYRIFLLILLAVLPAGVYSYPGQSAAEPITFTELSEWIQDARSSLELFEETIRTDILAARINYFWNDKQYYVKMDNGSTYPTKISHFTFQGMFWGPIFTYGVWEVPATVLDLANLAINNDGSMIFNRLNLDMLNLAISANEIQSAGAVPFSGLIRINVLFSMDYLLMDFIDSGKSGQSILGRSYAGLTFKIMEVYYIFAGFNFLHYPYVEGWQSFVSNDKAFSSVSGIPRYAFGTEDFSYNDLLYETRTKLFFYQNILNFLQIRTLLNIDAEQLLDMIGAGFIFRFFGMWDFNSIFSYLQSIEKMTLDLMGKVHIFNWLSLSYKYNLAIKPFEPLDYLKLGLDLILPLGDSPAGTYAIYLNGYAVTYFRNDVRQYGYYGAFGINLPLSTRLEVGVGYNVDVTMEKLPFSADTLTYFVSFEIGMDNNLNYKLEPVYREP
ncbi:MAG: hypothetical protein A2Y33_09920 [Spirochaetes bacterium GWF1_51_8]|nr:MAG: hypothetical protein A2Y33_09920 [Spirochaetes bacterium GWF1_51_8]